MILEGSDAMNRKVLRAKIASVFYHWGQVDKGGKAYFLHPWAVAKACDSDDAKIVAYLHDVIEDNPSKFNIKKANKIYGFVIADALDDITHKPGEKYADYLVRVKGNDLAREVKLKDLLHNSDISRIPNPTQKDFDRVNKKYKDAYEYLTT